MDIDDLLKQSGWESINFAGSPGGLYTLPDRFIETLYSVIKHEEGVDVRLSLTVSTQEFSNACTIISGRDENNSSLISLIGGTCITDVSINEGRFPSLLSEFVKWGREKDLKNAIVEHSQRPTNSAGATPLWHLASLSLLGEIDKLKFYKKSFQSGNRLGFVNYITEDYIDRAINLAKKYKKKKSLWDRFKF